jgi:hypothetical protein
LEWVRVRVIICLLGRKKNQNEKQEELLLAPFRDTASSPQVARLVLFQESCS